MYINQCSDSGSGRIGIILLDPDPYPFQPNVKVNYTGTFLRKFLYNVQNIESYDTYDADEKDKAM